MDHFISLHIAYNKIICLKIQLGS